MRAPYLANYADITGRPANILFQNPVEWKSCLPYYRLNKCGVISPRYDVRHGDIETWMAKLLPSRL